MVGEGVVARPAEARVSTGVPSLDAMLEGGLVAHRPYLIVGPSGTGKTTLAIQFLCEGVRRNERGLLVTLEEPPNEARVNHRGLEPLLGRVEVFDAIPDIMRYERTPFKDIASVRTAVPFGQVPYRIRQSPELASVEVTITALEQMLRTEVIRKGYTRLVIDSLTALQYFCMKGFDPVGGAQSLLRFLSDLRVTTLLTVEAPLEDVETPERMLARGEIRLFRWELDGQTVRAVGVEKFRGSSHDVRLHPYRIGPQGIDINLDVTISRDTRQIIEPIVPRIVIPVATAPLTPAASPVTPLMDEVRDLILIGADVAPARSEIAAALAATIDGRPDQAQAHLSRVSSLVIGLVDQLSRATDLPADPAAKAALQRVLARADSVRAGVPPTSLPPASALQVQLGALLSLLPPPAPPPPPPAAVASIEEVPPSPVTVLPPPPSLVVAVPPSPPVPAEPAPAPPPAPEVAPSPPAEPPKPEEPVSPPPAAEVPAPSPVIEPEPPPAPPVAPASEPPVPEPVSVPTEPTPAAAPLPAVETPPTPAPEPAVPARAVRRLPAPPKPHPPVAGLRPTKAASAPAAHPGSPKAGPPPLPSTAVPEWPSAPLSSAPRHAAAAAHPSARAAQAHAAVSPGQERVVSPAAGKKRRKGTVAPAGKRSAAPKRAAAPHEPEARMPSPPHPVPAPALSVAPPTAASVPHEPAGAPKARRRTPRKRKAPPVVSATPEPIPPGALGEPFPGAKATDDPEPPPAPEE
jgi:KaiC/GvpD/RAD55 family RecA-like ATPase